MAHLPPSRAFSLRERCSPERAPSPSRTLSRLLSLSLALTCPCRVASDRRAEASQIRFSGSFGFARSVPHVSRRNSPVYAALPCRQVVCRRERISLFFPLQKKNLSYILNILYYILYTLAAECRGITRNDERFRVFCRRADSPQRSSFSFSLRTNEGKFATCARRAGKEARSRARSRTQRSREERGGAIARSAATELLGDENSGDIR